MQVYKGDILEYYDGSTCSFTYRLRARRNGGPGDDGLHIGDAARLDELGELVDLGGVVEADDGRARLQVAYIGCIWGV